jgi:hypothetical protein
MEGTKEDPAVSKHMTKYYMADPPEVRRRHGDTPLILPSKCLSDSLTTAEESSLEKMSSLKNIPTRKEAQSIGGLQRCDPRKEVQGLQ